MSCGCGGERRDTRPVPEQQIPRQQTGQQTARQAWREEFVSPGEVKNPVGTERLMRYWTEGPGAAKIGWGAPCDFCSCLRHLRKYVPRRMLKGLCANLHHRALGMWPGEHTVGRDKGAGCPC